MFKPFLDRLGISQLKPMQEAAIKAVEAGTSLVLISPTGSGKTLAFLLPLMNLMDNDRDGVQSLILTPSRELALQIEQVFRQLQSGLKVNTCYGGHPMKTERNNLKEPPALLIGTPGRIADHLRRETFSPSGIRFLVLDEFDKSLELGFRGEMEFIIGLLNNLDTRILTSATALTEIPEFAGVVNPTVIDFTENSEPQKLSLNAIRATGTDKLETLYRLIGYLGNEPALIFCNHRETVGRISDLLAGMGVMHGIYHGGLDQEDRELALIRFRNGTHHLLLTTDLASRGLDIPEIKHVIHYQWPLTETAWTHRNGRTARMHAHGSAWLVMAEEDFLPGFITGEPKFIQLPESVQPPKPTEWETLYIGAGKKDKISKGDVAGFLMQKGNLAKDDLGKIEILDYASFAAVKRDKMDHLLKLTSNEQIKKKNVRIAVAK